MTALDTPQRHVAKERIRNSSSDAINSEDPIYKGLVAAGGSIAYAIMDLANAIREGQSEDHTRDNLLTATQQLVEDSRKALEKVPEGSVEHRLLKGSLAQAQHLMADPDQPAPQE